MAENNMPEPNPMLKTLEPLIGSWEMSGRTEGADTDNVSGKISFEWLPGGFFLKQHAQINFMGMEIDSLELVGHDPQTDSLKSQVYTNMSPMPLPYEWAMDGNKLTISVKYGPLDATMHGELSEDGDVFTSSWGPNEDADPAVNVPYTISGHRVK